MKPFLKKKSSDNPEGYMGILEHLDELRTRLIVSILILFVAMLISMAFADTALSVLFRPLENVEIVSDQENLRVFIDSDGSGIFQQLPTDQDSLKRFSPRGFDFYLPGSDPEGPPSHTVPLRPNKPVFLSPIEPIMLWLKMSFLLGLILAFPFLLHQVWLFVAPGLLPDERRALIPILALAAFLFPLGAGFAYIVFQPILGFLVNFQISNIEPMLNANLLINVELKFMMGFGLAFEMPIAVMFLTFMGLLTPQRLREWRPYSIVIIAFLSAMLTPPDPLSMIVMMLPLFALYEISILLSIPVARKQKERHEELEKWLEASDTEEEDDADTSSEDDSRYKKEPPRGPIGGHREGLTGDSGGVQPSVDPAEMDEDFDDDDYVDYEQYYARKAREQKMRRSRLLRKKLHRKRRRGSK